VEYLRWRQRGGRGRDRVVGEMKIAVLPFPSLSFSDTESIDEREDKEGGGGGIFLKVRDRVPSGGSGAGRGKEGLFLRFV